MKTIKINADEALWRTLARRRRDTIREGHAIAQIRIEGALHDMVAPASGRLAISPPSLTVIDPF
jgi:hypothetical protein